MSTETITRGYVDAPSGQIHYREVGTGAPIVFLHQTATTGRIFEPIMLRLADQFRCIAFDTPGFGQSDPPPSMYRMPEYAAAIAAAARQVGAERFNLLGHHTGASIAAQIAADFPDRVTRLILHACPTGTKEFRQEKLAEAAPVPLEENGAHVDWVIKRLTGYSTKLPPDELHPLIVEYLIALPRFWEAHAAVWNQYVDELAPRITSPVLLMTGEFDMFVDEQSGLAQKFPNARAMLLKGRGRLAMQEAPDEYAKIVRDFFST